MYPTERERQESNYSDPFRDKRLGETEDEWKVRKEKDRSYYSSSNSSYTDKSLQTPDWAPSAGEFFDAIHIPFKHRTLMGKIVLRLGQGLLALTLIIWMTNLELPSIMGWSSQKWTLIGSLFFFGLAYLSELAGTLLIVYGIWSLYKAGGTPDGFSLTVIPAAIWGKSALVALGGYALGKIFGLKSK